MRCADGKQGKLECASNNGVDCLWGKFTKQKNMALLSEQVISTKPLQVDCPGWQSSDGTDTCDRLGCKPGNTLFL